MPGTFTDPQEQLLFALDPREGTSKEDQLFLTPVTTVTRARDLTGVTYPTARADLRRLAGLGIVRQIPGPTRISYACFPIIDIVYGD